MSVWETTAARNKKKKKDKKKEIAKSSLERCMRTYGMAEMEYNRRIVQIKAAWCRGRWGTEVCAQKAWRGM